MNWKQHLLIGITAEIIFIFIAYRFLIEYEAINTILIIQLLTVVIISPLISDIDHENGKLHQFIMGTSLTAATIGLFHKYYEPLNKILTLGIITATITFFIAQKTRHRGFIHSITFCIIYSLITFLMFRNVILSIIAFIGSYSHLAADKLFFKLV